MGVRVEEGGREIWGEGWRQICRERDLWVESGSERDGWEVGGGRVKLKDRCGY